MFDQVTIRLLEGNSFVNRQRLKPFDGSTPRSRDRKLPLISTGSGVV